MTAEELAQKFYIAFEIEGEKGKESWMSIPDSWKTPYMRVARALLSDPELKGRCL